MDRKMWRTSVGKVCFFILASAMILGIGAVRPFPAAAQTEIGAGFAVKGEWVLLSVDNALAPGLGKVTSSSAGCLEFNEESEIPKCISSKKISCAGLETDVCEAYFKTGTKITLTGTPSAGTGPCVLWTMDSGPFTYGKAVAATLATDTAISVMFWPATDTGALSVLVDDPGETATCFVNSVPAGITGCNRDGGTCEASFPLCTKITLSTKAGKNLFFTGWGTDGMCAGTAASCSFMLYPETVNAAAPKTNAAATKKATKVEVKVSTSGKSTLQNVDDIK